MTRTEQIRKAAMEHASYKQQGRGVAYIDFVRTAEWADRTLIGKACEWLDSINTDLYMDSGIFQMCDLIRDFKKAMEE